MAMLRVLLLAYVVLFLMKCCTCITTYEQKSHGSESLTSHDYGEYAKYQPSEYDNENAVYRFGYKVNAVETGDVKQHIESRVKNEVKGAYSVTEPNGASRSVQYIANSKGFNAVVRSQYGTLFAKRLSENPSKPNANDRQAFRADIFNKVAEIRNSTNVIHNQSMTFDKFQQQRPKPQQRARFRQSSPKSIINLNSLSFHDNSTETAVPVVPNTESNVPTKQIVGRRQQYEVIDPEVDIDIWRSIPKPFLNLEIEKQRRKKRVGSTGN